MRQSATKLSAHSGELTAIAAVCGEFGFFCLELFYFDIIPIVATKAIDYSFIYLVSYWIRKIA